MAHPKEAVGSERLQAARSAQEVYDAALEAITDALGCERASILLFDSASVMRFVAWKNISEQYPAPIFVADVRDANEPREAVDGHSPWTPETIDPEALKNVIENEVMMLGAWLIALPVAQLRRSDRDRTTGLAPSPLPHRGLRHRAFARRSIRRTLVMLEKVGLPNTADGGAEVYRETARRYRIMPLLITGAVVTLAGLLAWTAWDSYMETPWTRDGTVRAYVITETPEVSGKIVNLPVIADQYVHKGDLVMEIDPTNYHIAVDRAQAVVAQTKADFNNKHAEETRRLKLTSLAISQEEQQSYAARSQSAEAIYEQARASLAQAKLDLSRTRIVSPVNGYVTNLFVQVGDYATAGQHVLTVINSDSFWVDGYFEETVLRSVRVGDSARVSLTGLGIILGGHVVGVARGISVPNAQADPAGLATVNPIFTWIRLAQRIPVRVALDNVPPEVTLAVGLTATVEIHPRLARERGTHGLR